MCRDVSTLQVPGYGPVFIAGIPQRSQKTYRFLTSGSSSAQQSNVPASSARPLKHPRLHEARHPLII